MDSQPTHFQLRSVVHDTLKSHQGQISDLTAQHEGSLKQLFLMFKPRNNMLDKEYDHQAIQGGDESLEGFDEWREQ